MKRQFGILLLFTMLAACSSTKKVDLRDQADSPSTTSFERGVKSLEQERYAEAASIFDTLLVSKPATELDLITMYNSGAAYEGLGDCKVASERYREVVRSSAGKFKRIESQALFRLSLAYECLGQNAKTITALLDARKRAVGLPESTIIAEIPARLAAAYARIGNRTKAVEYIQIANKGLKRLVSQESGRRQTETLGNTLFLMGQLNPGQRRAEGDGLIYLQGLSMQQPYLLQAAELNHPLWSKRAAEDLDMAYDNIWKFKYEDLEKQNQFYVRALQVIRELQRIRLPDSNATVEGVFKKLAQSESRLQAEMARVAETNRLTPEAEKREGLKREGRVVAPAPKTQAKPPTKKR